MRRWILGFVVVAFSTAGSACTGYPDGNPFLRFVGEDLASRDLRQSADMSQGGPRRIYVNESFELDAQNQPKSRLWEWTGCDAWGDNRHLFSTVLDVCKTPGCASMGNYPGKNTGFVDGTVCSLKFKTEIRIETRPNRLRFRTNISLINSDQAFVVLALRPLNGEPVSIVKPLQNTGWEGILKIPIPDFSPPYLLSLSFSAAGIIGGGRSFYRIDDVVLEECPVPTNCENN